GRQAEQPVAGGPGSAGESLGKRLGELLRSVLPISVDPSAQTPGTCPDSLGMSEVQTVSRSHHQRSPLAGSGGASRPGPTGSLAGGDTTGDWVIRAGWGESSTSGSARAWGRNSPGPLDSWCSARPRKTRSR